MSLTPHSAPAAGPKNGPDTAVISCMRNEGPFVLEWLAYHLGLGFDRAVICTNDCTDGSDTLLDLLAERGLVTHLRHSPAPGQAPQDSGIRAALAALEGTSADWVLFIDADEFLNIRIGDGGVQALLQNAGATAATGATASPTATPDVIALPWRFFGNAGHSTWPEGEVIAAYDMAEDAPDPSHINFKSMFRRASFGHAHDHMPQAPRVADPRVVAASGAALPNRPVVSSRKFRKYEPQGVSVRWDIAQINHYAVKSDDLFLMKNDRGDGQNGLRTGKRYHLGWKWHRAANRNTAPERSIQRHLPALRARLAGWRADPAIARAETACLDWHHSRMGQVLTPARRRKWTHQEAPA